MVEETTYVIDPHSSDSDNSSSDGDSGGEDVGENSDDDERGGDDETMVITFEDPGDNDDHDDDHGDDDEEDDEDDDDDDDEDEEEDEISSVNRPEGLLSVIVNFWLKVAHSYRNVKLFRNHSQNVFVEVRMPLNNKTRFRSLMARNSVKKMSHSFQHFHTRTPLQNSWTCAGILPLCPHS